MWAVYFKRGFARIVLHGTHENGCTDTHRYIYIYISHVYVRQNDVKLASLVLMDDDMIGYFLQIHIFPLVQKRLLYLAYSLVIHCIMHMYKHCHG